MKAAREIEMRREIETNDRLIHGTPNAKCNVYVESRIFWKIGTFFSVAIPLGASHVAKQ
jgi:hypothetical protein